MLYRPGTIALCHGGQRICCRRLSALHHSDLESYNQVYWFSVDMAALFYSLQDIDI